MSGFCVALIVDNFVCDSVQFVCEFGFCNHKNKQNKMVESMNEIE